jgi:hypothetical protein
MGLFDSIRRAVSGGDSDTAESDGDESGPADSPGDGTGPELVDTSELDAAALRDRASAVAGEVEQLDFSLSSLDQFDDAIDAGYDETLATSEVPTMYATDAVRFGCYLGEVLIRAYDGEWTRDPVWGVTVTGPEGSTTVAVFAVAERSITTGSVFAAVADRAAVEVGLDADSAPVTDADPSDSTATPESADTAAPGDDSAASDADGTAEPDDEALDESTDGPADDATTTDWDSDWETDEGTADAPDLTLTDDAAAEDDPESLIDEAEPDTASEPLVEEAESADQASTDSPVSADGSESLFDDSDTDETTEPTEAPEPSDSSEPLFEDRGPDAAADSETQADTDAADSDDQDGAEATTEAAATERDSTADSSRSLFDDQSAVGSPDVPDDEVVPDEPDTPDDEAVADQGDDTTTADTGESASDSPAADTGGSDPTTGDDLRGTYAEAAEELVSFWTEYSLDYTPESLQRLDALVSAEWADDRFDDATFGSEATFDDRVFSSVSTELGSYFGEVLVRELDAEWSDETATDAVVVEGADGPLAIPVLKVAGTSIRQQPVFARSYDSLLSDLEPDT